SDVCSSDLARRTDRYARQQLTKLFPRPVRSAVISDVLAEAREKMSKAVEVAKDDFSNVRTGRANPALFQKVLVDYYGSPTPLEQLAGLQNQDARTLLITPYDKTALKDIE